MLAADRLYVDLSSATGCRVILRDNLCIEHGLENGSFVTVKYVIYDTELHPPGSNG